MKSIHYISFFAITLFLASCGTKESTDTTGEVAGTGKIEISNTQFTTAGMALGSLQTITFSESVQATGIVEAPPAGKAQISSLLPGTIKYIAVNTGSKVAKGQLLCSLLSNEFVQLQQDYAESVSRLKSSRAEYERQKTLAGENIASEKTFLNAEGEYNSLKARCEGLKTRLRMLGLDPATVEGGTIVPEIRLYAPISGFVSAMNAETGMYSEPQSMLMEVIDLAQMQLKLSIFEKDVTNTIIGNEVRFYSPSNPKMHYTGRIITLSRAIHPETKAITILAEIDRSGKEQLINGMYVEAVIKTGERNVHALPNEAILKSGDTRMVLVQTSNADGVFLFKSVEVKIGLSQGGFTEIIEPAALENVLVKGGFNMME